MKGGEVGGYLLLRGEQRGESWESKCAKVPVQTVFFELRPRDRQWR